MIDHPSDLSREGRTDPALLEALMSPAMYGGSLPVVVHETHASWVFVFGERAYKIKKPVALGFLDYSTLSRRHAACREEVRVNKDLAPGIYLGVRAIVRTPHGVRLAAEGAPQAVEYAVEMQSFDEADTMDGMIAAGSHVCPGTGDRSVSGELPPLRARSRRRDPERGARDLAREHPGAGRPGASPPVAR